AQVASAITDAIAAYQGNLVDFIVGTLAYAATSSDPAGLSFASTSLSALITSGALNPGAIASYVAENLHNDLGLSVMLGVAGTVDPASQNGAAFAVQVANATFHLPLSTSLTAALAGAVSSGELTAGQAALILGVAAPNTTEMTALATAPGADLVA